MRRSGFTMIELIFVIVILGILASVAIPKLSATRDDAKVAAAATTIGNAISEVASYYTARGSFDNANYQTMSNALTESAWALHNTSDNNKTIIHYKTNSNLCIGLFISGSDINVSYDSDGDMFDGVDAVTAGDTLCTNLRAVVREQNNSVGGSGVSFN